MINDKLIKESGTIEKSQREEQLQHTMFLLYRYNIN